eukprot:6479638-Prymnesium_polylepis.2
MSYAQPSHPTDSGRSSKISTATAKNGRPTPEPSRPPLGGLLWSTTSAVAKVGSLAGLGTEGQSATVLTLRDDTANVTRRTSATEPPTRCPLA